MLAVAFQSGELTVLSDAPIPVPAKNEILVRVLKAGICETDLQLVQGYMGFRGVLGHEFVGIAESGEHAGRRVVGEINCNCRDCPRCSGGLGNHCGNRTVIGIDRHDGAFAEFVAVPEHNLHVVPDSVTVDEAVFVEPLAAAFQISDQVSIRSSDRVLILGDGRLSLMSAKALTLTGAELTVVGKHKPKLTRFQFAARRIVLGDPIEDEYFDVVIDCTGSPTGLPLALQKVRPRGTVVMKTTVASNHDLSLAAIVINEINLVGSRCGPFDKAIRALADQSVKLENLITNRYELSSAAEAFKQAIQPDAFKVVFDVG